MKDKTDMKIEELKEAINEVWISMRDLRDSLKKLNEHVKQDLAWCLEDEEDD